MRSLVAFAVARRVTILMISMAVVALTLPAEAVRVALPGPRASTTPLPLTRATEAAELVHRTES